MKIIILTLFVLLTIGAHAQYEIDVRFPYPEWEVYKNKPNGEKYNVSIFTQTLKGKRLEETFSFNAKGLVESEQWFKRNGKIAKFIERRYTNTKEIMSRRVVVKNKIRNLYEYTYKDDSLLTQAKMYFKDTINPMRITEYEYTHGNKYKLMAGYNGKKKQLYRYEYDYYENGSHKESRYYKKGKLKNTWVFDCDQKGELVQPNTASICKKRTYKPDSSFTEVYENTAKGKVSRTIITSTADGRVLESSVYNAKGNLKSKSVYDYNTENKLVKHRIYKGNSTFPKTTELYEYGSDSNLSTSIRLSHNGDIKYRREYTYN